MATAKCPKCKRVCELSLYGKFLFHKNTTGKPCPGAGYSPREAEKLDDKIHFRYVQG